MVEKVHRLSSAAKTNGTIILLILLLVLILVLVLVVLMFVVMRLLVIIFKFFFSEKKTLVFRATSLFLLPVFKFENYLKYFTLLPKCLSSMPQVSDFIGENTDIWNFNNLNIDFHPISHCTYSPGCTVGAINKII